VGWIGSDKKGYRPKGWYNAQASKQAHLRRTSFCKRMQSDVEGVQTARVIQPWDPERRRAGLARNDCRLRASRSSRRGLLP
jgi:hypothetical protein